MGSKAAKLAGLAALAGVAYANRDKLFGSKSGTPDLPVTKDEDEPRRKITDYAKEAPKDPREAGSEVSGGSSDVFAKKSGATRSAAPAPVAKSVESSNRNEDYSNEGRPPVVSRTYMTKTPGGNAKRTEGNAPMPSLRAVEARVASNKTDAMRNASRANVAEANRMKRMAANPEAQAAERMYPEEYMVGGPSLKTIGAAAKAAANRGANVVERSAAPFLKEIGMSERGAASATAPRIGGPSPQLTGPSKADLVARDRAARAAARDEGMRAENAANYGLNPEAPGYSASAGALRDKLGGADFSLGMKKGGAVKAKRMASGGMTSKAPSASRRGDGIASRGKTRGKIC